MCLSFISIIHNFNVNLQHLISILKIYFMLNKIYTRVKFKYNVTK